MKSKCSFGTVPGTYTVKEKVREAEMEQGGIDRGAKPSDWFCLLKDLSETRWEFIETWDGKEWIEFDEKIFDEEKPFTTKFTTMDKFL